MDIFFEVDINNCFNYTDVMAWIKNITDLEVSRYFHRSDSIKEFRKIYKNLEKIIEKIFKWDSERFKNPIDQYIYISQNTGEIIEMIFKGVKQEEHDILAFKAGVIVYFQNFAYLPDMALKHNFGEPIDDHFLGID